MPGPDRKSHRKAGLRCDPRARPRRGQLFGLPLYKHGGGGVGDDAREDEYGEVLDLQACVRECDSDVEIASIRALRDAFPGYPLRIDPNCPWSVETSVCVGRALKNELAGGGYLEDPCATLEGMAEVRRPLVAENNHTPQASNVAVTSFADVPRARELDAVQIVLSDWASA